MADLKPIDELVERLRACPSIDNARILPVGQRVPEVIVPTTVADRAADTIESQASLICEAIGVLETYSQVHGVIVDYDRKKLRDLIAKLKGES